MDDVKDRAPRFDDVFYIRTSKANVECLIDCINTQLMSPYTMYTSIPYKIYIYNHMPQ